jgi:large subunit ribosomal protein L34e
LHQDYRANIKNLSERLINGGGFTANMVSGRHKSRTMRRVHVKVPGGATKLHYKLRKPKPAKCSMCGDVLKGVARERPVKMRNLAKTKKRPERPYGGILCSKCMRKKIVDSVTE